MEGFKEFQELQQLMAGAEENAKLFTEKGNKSAGVRLRKAMQDVKSQAQVVREAVLEKSK